MISVASEVGCSKRYGRKAWACFTRGLRIGREGRAEVRKSIPGDSLRHGPRSSREHVDPAGRSSYIFHMAIHRLGLPGAFAEAPAGQRQTASVTELNDRAREVLRGVVESYVETGEPVGSRALTRKITEPLSPATIRNIMADLQDLGLLY